MNFKLKALVAAVALVAVAGQASAAIQAGSSNTTSPNGELVFYAYGTDASGNVFSYVKDLGVAFNTFVAAPSYAAVNLNTDANWTAFTSTAATGSQYWGVFATQRLNSATSTLANGISVLTTAQNNDVTTVSAMKNAALVNAYSNGNNAITQINLADSSALSVNNSYFFGSAPVSTGTPIANFGAYLGSDFSGVFFNSTNVIGTTTSAAFFDISRGAGSNSAGVPTVANVNADGAWHFNGGSLDYSMAAAVPEPETYAMMAAGLLLLGAVSRRRRV